MICRQNYGKCLSLILSVISLERFFVTTIVKPDGESTYEKFKSLYFRQYADIAEAKIQQQTAIIDAETQAQRTVIESQAIATKRQQEGYTYQQERGFDVAQDVAKNEAVGQFTNMGVGFGTMAGVGGAVGGVVGNAVGNAIDNAGQPQQTVLPQNDMSLFQAKIQKLQMLKESGMLTDEEFSSMKQQLLSSIM